MSYPAPPATKVCGECGLEKPAAEFYETTDKRYPGLVRLSAACRPCMAIRLCRARAKKRAKHGFDAWSVMHYYGITVEQYEEAFARQGGVCAVCGREPEEGRQKGLVVDHDHETRRFRGLLCRLCNVGIGVLNDDPEALRAAADYVERARLAGSS